MAASVEPPSGVEVRRTWDGGQNRLVPALVEFIIRERSLSVRLAILVGVLAVATGLRFIAGFVTQGVPLAFYVPAVMVVTLLAGWRLGLLSLFLSSVFAWYVFMPPLFSFTPLSPEQTSALVIWFLISASQVLIAEFLLIALKHARRSDIRSRRLLDVASGIVWITDANGHVHEPQAGWTELTGMDWPRYGALGWMEAIHEDDRARVRPATPHDRETLHETELRLWSAPDGDWRWYYARAVPVPSPSGRGREWITALRDIHDQKLARERGDLVVGELRHRLKNLVTVIEALAKSSRERGNPAVENFLQKFLGRLRALGAAGDLVLAGGRAAVECSALVHATLAPFMEENSARIRIDGPLLQLSEETGGGLALAAHELATNALKYGALSVPGGTVSLCWSVARGADGERVTIEWKESGGPKPVPPQKEGFGSRVIRSVCMRERNGEVRIDYPPDGVCCRIAFDKVAEGPPLAAARSA